MPHQPNSALMNYEIIEIKASLRDVRAAEKILTDFNARFIGADRQKDTYFRVAEGRLKLRVGNIENALIYYKRADQAGPKRSDVTLYKTQPGDGLKDFLEQAIGVVSVVEKVRRIYFIDNVKIHLDEVVGLGSFIEIEAIDADGSIGIGRLREQCGRWMEAFGILQTDLLENSYSDMTALAE